MKEWIVAYEAGRKAVAKWLVENGEYEHGNCDESCAEREILTVRIDREKLKEWGIDENAR